MPNNPYQISGGRRKEPEPDASCSRGVFVAALAAYAAALYPLVLMALMIGTWGATSWIIGHPAIPGDDWPGDGGRIVNAFYLLGEIMLLVSPMMLLTGVVLPLLVPRQTILRRLFLVMFALGGWWLFHEFWKADPWMIVFWFWD
jgi:hypothetical protein